MKAIQKLTERGLHGLFQQMHGESFKVSYADGSIERYGEGVPRFTICLHDKYVFSVSSDDLSIIFGEAYIKWSV